MKLSDLTGLSYQNINWREFDLQRYETFQAYIPITLPLYYRNGGNGGNGVSLGRRSKQIDPGDGGGMNYEYPVPDNDVHQENILFSPFSSTGVTEPSPRDPEFKSFESHLLSYAVDRSPYQTDALGYNPETTDGHTYPHHRVHCHSMNRVNMIDEKSSMSHMQPKCNQSTAENLTSTSTQLSTEIKHPPIVMDHPSAANGDYIYDQKFQNPDLSALEPPLIPAAHSQVWQWTEEPLSLLEPTFSEFNLFVDEGKGLHDDRQIPATCDSYQAREEVDISHNSVMPDLGQDKLETRTSFHHGRPWSYLKDSTASRSPTPSLSWTSSYVSSSSSSSMSSAYHSRRSSSKRSSIRVSPCERGGMNGMNGNSAQRSCDSRTSTCTWTNHLSWTWGCNASREAQSKLRMAKTSSGNTWDKSSSVPTSLSAADLRVIDAKCKAIQSNLMIGTNPEIHIPKADQSTPQQEDSSRNILPSQSSDLDQIDSTNLSPDSSYETEDSCDETEYIDSPFPDSPDSGARTNIVRPVLSPIKLQLVNRLMDEFYRLFDVDFGIQRHAQDTTGSHSQGSPSWEQRQAASNGASGSGGQKRKSRDNEDLCPTGGGSDGDPNKRRQINPSTPASKSAGGRKLACPFYKRNPIAYSDKRACVYPGFPSISRVKEHLYRKHALPVQCPRCCKTFSKEEDCLQHQRALESCEIKEAPPLEGVSKAQEMKLRSKRMPKSSLSDEDRWKLIYKILFPEAAEDQVPSAYCDFGSPQVSTPSTSPESHEFVLFEEFSKKRLPELVRSSLEVAVETNSQMQLLEKTLKSKLVEIVRDCQAKLFTLYQETRRPDSSAPTPFHTGTEYAQRTVDTGPTTCPPQTELASVVVPPSPVQEEIGNSADWKEIQQRQQTCPEKMKSQSDSGYGSAHTSFEAVEASVACQPQHTPVGNKNQEIGVKDTAGLTNGEEASISAHAQHPNPIHFDQSSIPPDTSLPEDWELFGLDPAFSSPNILDNFLHRNWALSEDEDDIFASIGN